MSMTTREVAEHIDAFKYWCKTNEEMGVITLPKFLCDHIIEILDDTNARPHGEWIFKNGKYRCTACGEKAIYLTFGMSNIPKEILTDFCPNCGASMQANDRQVTGKLNSEIEKSKSEICPCISCEKYTYCRLKDCDIYQKWKESE